MVPDTYFPLDPKVLFDDESYKIMGAMFQVYKEMSCGFLDTKEKRH